MFEARFRIRGDSTYATATAGTETTVELWCNDHCDLLYVDGDPPVELLNRIRDQVGMDETLSSEGETLIVTGDCLKKHEQNHIEKYLAKHNCLLLPPLAYTDGYKLCRVLALSSTNLTEFYREITEDFNVTLDTKRSIDEPPNNQSTEVFETEIASLSARQREALLLATEEGYYEIPRNVTTETLAGALGINRRTFEDHLRRAENKIIGNVANYL
jgi:predicted DNA binding protein